MLLLVGCGGGGSSTPDAYDPTMVPFGETAIVVVVNPVINDGNDTNLPAPGATQENVTVSADDGTMHTTGPDGVAVLAPITAGARTLTLAGTDVGGSVTVNIADGQLIEVAVASADVNTAEIMASINYTTDQVIEILPTMTNQEVNDILMNSNQVVFIRGGTYTGDINFVGSRTTLFGEGVLGGQVTLEGNFSVTGSNSRIRGATITGTLDIQSSGVGVSFSRVNGLTSFDSSDLTLLADQLCGGLMLGNNATGTAILGNSGVAPRVACP